MFADRRAKFRDLYMLPARRDCCVQSHNLYVYGEQSSD